MSLESVSGGPDTPTKSVAGHQHPLLLSNYSTFGSCTKYCAIYFLLRKPNRLRRGPTRLVRPVHPAGNPSRHSKSILCQSA